VAKFDHEFIATRKTLIKRLKNLQDQSSWQDFFDTYWKPIYFLARQKGLTETESQDIVQETMLGVAKHIPSFRYNPKVGSFKSWLFKMTNWRIADQIRKNDSLDTRPLSTTDRHPHTFDHTDDERDRALDLFCDAEEWRKHLLEVALEKVKRQLDPRKYQIFDFYVNKDWSPKKVARLFRVPVSQVYITKHRVTELIKEEAARLDSIVP
jgi:RNA polymerase sigma-70 factor (ECF subfamily)